MKDKAIRTPVLVGVFCLLFAGLTFSRESFVDAVQVTTQMLVAGTAVVTAWLAWRTYFRQPEQSQEEEPESAQASSGGRLRQLVVFKTPHQTTTLRVVDNGLECHLDDVREGKGGHQWTLTRAQGAEFLRLEQFKVTPGSKVAVGTFSIGPRRDWLYSKRLFPNPDYLHGSLKELLQNASTVGS